MGCYSTKRNEPPSHEKTGGKPQYILLRKRSPSLKGTHYIITTVGYSGKGKTIETVKGPVVAKGRLMGEGQSVSETTLYDTGMMDTCHYAFVKTLM